MNIQKISLPAACFALLLVGACSEPRIGGNTPIDQNFGDAVRAAQAQQTLNPRASENRTVPMGMDGQAAKSTIDRYEKSFEAPPAPVNVYTIGVGSGTGTGSGSSSGR